MGFAATPPRLSTADADFEAKFAARLQWSAETDAQVESSVAEILRDVRQRGDDLVLPRFRVRGSTHRRETAVVRQGRGSR